MSLSLKNFAWSAWLGICAANLFASLEASAEHTLWKLQGKSNTVYLLGSVHMLPPDSYPLPPALEKAGADSGKLVLEALKEDVESSETQLAMLAKGMYQDGSTLQEHISEEAGKLLLERAEEAGVPIQALERMKPWMAGLTLVALEMNKHGFDVNHGVDRYFEGKAKEAGKKIEGLESATYQIDLFVKLTENLGEELLLQTLKESNQLMEMLDEMVTAWKKGDTAKLESIILDSFKEYPEIKERILVERNRNWIPKIEGYLSEEQNVLVVVGAAHLIGEDGVVEMLRAKGHQVEQL